MNEATGWATGKEPNLPTIGEVMGPRLNESGLITVALISGARVHCRVRDIWAVLADTHSIIFFLIAGLIFGYLYPSDHLTTLEWWKQAESVLIGIAILILTLGTLLSSLAAASRWVNWLVAPVPVLLMISVATMEILCRPIAHWTWNARWLSNPELVRLIATNYIVFLSFEIFFSVFVFPTTRRGKDLLAHSTQIQAAEAAHRATHRGSRSELGYAALNNRAEIEERLPAPAFRDAPKKKSDSAPSGTDVFTVQIGSERFSLQKLRMIRAEEHYVRITTVDGEKLLRYRFSDAIQHLPSVAGIQVHRSFWLSYNAISATARLPDGRLLVTLWNQKTLTVPRARKQQLEEALKTLSNTACQSRSIP